MKAGVVHAKMIFVMKKLKTTAKERAGLIKVNIQESVDQTYHE